MNWVRYIILVPVSMVVGFVFAELMVLAGARIAEAAADKDLSKRDGGDSSVLSAKLLILCKKLGYQFLRLRQFCLMLSLQLIILCLKVVNLFFKVLHRLLGLQPGQEKAAERSHTGEQ